MNNDSSGRILDGLRSWINTAPPGSQLPSTRTLVADYSASPVTVQKALHRLASEGRIETRPGVGAFVRAGHTARPRDFSWQTAALGTPMPRPSEASSALDLPHGADISLATGYPDPELLPMRLLRTALTRAARSDAGVRRPPAAGLPDLRAWFARQVQAFTPPEIDPPTMKDVVILPGSQSGLGAVLRSLVGAGAPVLMESPTYWGAILAAAQTGVEVVPVPAGPHGPDPALVADAFARTGARAFYAQPTFANPTGASWNSQIRSEIMNLVRERGTFLIEDDWAHDLAITADPSPLTAHDTDGHVVYLRSLTKSISTSMRVAAVIARGPALHRIVGDVRAESMYVSSLLQLAALEVVTHPGWRTHLRGFRRALRGRRDLLAASLAEHAPQLDIAALPQGGGHLWARLPEGRDPVAVTARCATEGVRVAPGDEFFPAEPAGPFLRLSFVGPDPRDFPEGARVLGAALQEG